MPRTAIVFPGQGSQAPGMLEALPEIDGLGRLVDAAEALSGLDLRALSLGAAPERLADTRAAQPLLYLADWAWGTALLELGVEPEAVAGHSLGEFAALAIAGVFSVEAGLELVVERSRLMAHAASAAPGTMAAVVGLDVPRIAEAIDGLEGVWIANDNCPGQVVISGTTEGVAAATSVLGDVGARRVIELPVAGAFHSPLMAAAAAAFTDVLEHAEFAEAGVPVVQNAEPTPVRDPAATRERLSRQMISPVRWTETMEALAAMGVETLVEAGPGDILTGLARRSGALGGLAASSAGLEAVYEEVVR